MTLIELLVVVIIATTLVVGVVPLLSPNNDARKIREAARELHTFVTRAQAEAARLGRPYGIALRESAADSGFALEAFMIAEPAPFAGFYEYSKVVRTNASGPNVWLQFVSFSTADNVYVEESMPPGMIRRGDRVEIGGVHYELIDGARSGDDIEDNFNTPFAPGDFYAPPNPNDWGGFRKSRFLARPVTSPPPFATSDFVYRNLNNQSERIGNASAPTPYVIHRQAAPTSGAPLSLPRGIGIDLVASGFDAVRFPIGEANNLTTPPVSVPPQVFDLLPAHPQFGRLLSSHWTGLETSSPPPLRLFDPVTPMVVGIMFQPSGAIESVVVNGERQIGYEQVFLLLGRVENAQSGVREAAWTANNYLTLPTDMANAVDFSSLGNSGADKEEFNTRREERNWLNEDSRWVAISASSGRAVVAENRFVDPRGSTVDFDYDSGSNGSVLATDFDDQITAAQGFAAEMRRLGGQ
ncbi:MAG: hypothetical protein CMJ58_00795 [Planctomycetaceae bacterium]|nr:hypothetical protein [Planctomycetaceae bacterium]